MRYSPESSARTLVLEDGRRLSYVVAGADGAPLVVLIHPAFGDHRCFAQQIDALVPHYRVAAIDLPGHGAAQSPGATTRIIDTSDLIAALVRQAGCQGAHLVGVSLGALVAQDFAARFPHMAYSLTVVGGYPIFGKNPTIQRIQALELLKLVPLLIVSLHRFRHAVARDATHTAQAREQFMHAAQGFTRRSLRAFAGNDSLLRQAFQSLALPLQIIVGEYERPLLRSVAEAWQRREPGSVLEVIPYAGHCANMDNPDVFNTRLSAFLHSARIAEY